MLIMGKFFFFSFVWLFCIYCCFVLYCQVLFSEVEQINKNCTNKLELAIGFEPHSLKCWITQWPTTTVFYCVSVITIQMRQCAAAEKQRRQTTASRALVQQQAASAVVATVGVWRTIGRDSSSSKKKKALSSHGAARLPLTDVNSRRGAEKIFIIFFFSPFFFFFELVMMDHRAAVLAEA